MTREGLTSGSGTRLAVMNLRLRIEKVAAQAVVDAFPSHSVNVAQSNVGNRLAFVLVAYESRVTPSELLGLLRLARHVYRRTSDVLHGRSSMVNFPAVLLAEWDVIVSRLETISRVGLPTVENTVLDR